MIQFLRTIRPKEKIGQRSPVWNKTALLFQNKTSPKSHNGACPCAKDIFCTCADGTVAIMRAIQGGANGLGRNVLELFVGRSGRIDASRLLEKELTVRKLWFTGATF